jgi:hypothetical protein
MKKKQILVMVKFNIHKILGSNLNEVGRVENDSSGI